MESRSAESAFKSIDDLLRGSGGGCSGSLEYMEQSSWLLYHGNMPMALKDLDFTKPADALSFFNSIQQQLYAA